MYIKKEIEMKEAKRKILEGEIIFTTNIDRRTFKTTSMLCLAYFKGRPLVVGRGIVRDNLRKTELGKYVSILSVSDVLLSGYRGEMIVDEISVAEYEQLKNSDITLAFSGFVYDERE